MSEQATSPEAAEREARVRRIMSETGMGREDAELAADVASGDAPTGDRVDEGDESLAD